MTKITRALLLSLVLAPASRAAETAVDADNVVIVLDGSGSMENFMEGTSMQRMEAAKRGLLEVLKRIPPETQVGVVVFSAVMPDPWIYPLGPRDDRRLERAIRSVSPAGGTPLGEYIQMGGTRLLAQRQAQHGYGTFRLLVVTDGEATDPDLVERYAPEVVARGITMDVIGVDMQETHTLAKKAHSYRSANDPKSLKKAVEEVFAEVSAGHGGSDVAAFDEIAALPAEMALDMIKTLSASGNHPIGAPAPTPTPEPDPAADPANSGGAPDASQPPVPSAPPGSSTPVPFPATQPSPAKDGSEILVALVGGLMFLILLGTAIGGNRKRNR